MSDLFNKLRGLTTKDRAEWEKQFHELTVGNTYTPEQVDNAYNNLKYLENFGNEGFDEFSSIPSNERGAYLDSRLAEIQNPEPEKPFLEIGEMPEHGYNTNQEEDPTEVFRSDLQKAIEGAVPKMLDDVKTKTTIDVGTDKYKATYDKWYGTSKKALEEFEAIANTVSPYYRKYGGESGYINYTEQDKLNLIARYNSIKDVVGEQKANEFLYDTFKTTASENQGFLEKLNDGLYGMGATIAGGLVFTAGMLDALTKEALGGDGTDRDLIVKMFDNEITRLGNDIVHYKTAFGLKEAKKAGLPVYEVITTAEEDKGGIWDNVWSINTIPKLIDQHGFTMMSSALSFGSSAISNTLFGAAKAGATRAVAAGTAKLGMDASKGLALTSKILEGLNKVQLATNTLVIPGFTGSVEGFMEGLNTKQMFLENAMGDINKLKNEYVEYNINNALNDKQLLETLGVDPTTEQGYYELLNFIESTFDDRFADLTARAEQNADRAGLNNAIFNSTINGILNVSLKAGLQAPKVQEALRRNKLGKMFYKPEFTVADGKVTSNISLVNQIRNVLAEPTGEFLEEYSQSISDAISSEGAENDLNNYIEQRLAGVARHDVVDDLVGNIQAGLVGGLKASVSKEALLAGIYGALSSGIGGANINHNVRFGKRESGESWLSHKTRNMPIIFRNPMLDAYNHQKAVKKESEEFAALATEWMGDPENKAKYDGLVGTYSWAASMQEALDNGDEFAYRNSALGKMVNDVFILNRLEGTAYQESFITNLNKVLDTEEGSEAAATIIQEYREDPGSKDTSMSDTEILESLKKNAKFMLDTMDSVQETVDLIDAQIGDNADNDVRQSLVYGKLALVDWKKRMDTIDEEVNKLEITSTESNHNLSAEQVTTLVEKGSKEAIVKERKDIENKISIAERIIERLEKSPSKTKAQITKLNDTRKELKKLKSDLNKHDKITKDILESDNTVLTEREILNLNSRERAIILDPANKDKYSKEQQAIIDNVIKQARVKDISFVDKMLDRARIELSYNKFLEQYNSILNNPENLKDYVAKLKKGLQRDILRKKIDPLKNITDYDEFVTSFDTVLSTLKPHEFGTVDKELRGTAFYDRYKSNANLLNAYHKMSLTIPKYTSKSDSERQLVEDALSYLMDNNIEVTIDNVADVFSTTNEDGSNEFLSYVKDLDKSIGRTPNTEENPLGVVVETLKDIITSYESNEKEKEELGDKPISTEGTKPVTPKPTTPKPVGTPTDTSGSMPVTATNVITPSVVLDALTRIFPDVKDELDILFKGIGDEYLNTSFDDFIKNNISFDSKIADIIKSKYGQKGVEILESIGNDDYIDSTIGFLSGKAAFYRKEVPINEEDNVKTNPISTLTDDDFLYEKEEGSYDDYLEVLNSLELISSEEKDKPSDEGDNKKPEVKTIRELAKIYLSYIFNKDLGSISQDDFGGYIMDVIEKLYIKPGKTSQFRTNVKITDTKVLEDIQTLLSIDNPFEFYTAYMDIIKSISEKELKVLHNQLVGNSLYKNMIKNIYISHNAYELFASKSVLNDTTDQEHYIQDDDKELFIALLSHIMYDYVSNIKNFDTLTEDLLTNFKGNVVPYIDMYNKTYNTNLTIDEVTARRLIKTLDNFIKQNTPKEVISETTKNHTNKESVEKTSNLDSVFNIQEEEKDNTNTEEDKTKLDETSTSFADNNNESVVNAMRDIYNIIKKDSYRFDNTKQALLDLLSEYKDSIFEEVDNLFTILEARANVFNSHSEGDDINSELYNKLYRAVTTVRRATKENDSENKRGVEEGPQPTSSTNILDNINNTRKPVNNNAVARSSYIPTAKVQFYNSVVGRAYKYYKIDEFIRSGKFSRTKDPVYFVNPVVGKNGKLLSEHVKAEMGDKYSDAYLPIMAVIRSEDGPLEINGKKYQPIGFLPSDNNKNNIGHAEAARIRKLALSNKDGSIIKKKNGTIVKSSALITADNKTNNIHDTSILKTMLNDMPIEDREKIEKGTDDGTIYNRYRDNLISKIAHVLSRESKDKNGKTSDGRVIQNPSNNTYPHLSVVIPSMKDDATYTEFNLSTVPIEDTVIGGIRFYDAVLDGANEVVNFNSRTRRFAETFNSFKERILKLEDIGFSMVNGQLEPDADTKVTLNKLEKDLKNALNRYIFVSKNYNYKIAYVLKKDENGDDYTVATIVMDTGNETFFLADLEDANADATLLTNLIVDSDGKHRLNGKYHIAKWQIPLQEFHDANHNSDETVRKRAYRNVSDIIDDHILVSNRSSFNYDNVEVKIDAVKLDDGNDLVDTPTAEEKITAKSSMVASSTVLLDGAIVDTASGVVVDGKKTVEKPEPETSLESAIEATKKSVLDLIPTSIEGVDAISEALAADEVTTNKPTTNKTAKKKSTETNQQTVLDFGFDSVEDVDASLEKEQDSTNTTEETDVVEQDENIDKVESTEAVEEEVIMEDFDDTIIVDDFTRKENTTNHTGINRVAMSGKRKPNRNNATRRLKYDFFSDESWKTKSEQVDKTIEKGKIYGLNKVKELFYKYNTDKEQRLLADRVFSIATNLGLQVSFLEKLDKQTAGQVDGDRMMFSENVTKNANTEVLPDILLHETIHTVTAFVIAAYENGELQSPTLIQAVESINKVYETLTNDKSVSDEYGMTNSRELIAELASPKFRNKLKAAKLWNTVKNAIKKIFLFESRVSANDVLSKALDDILDNFDYELFDSYNRSQTVDEADWNFYRYNSKNSWALLSAKTRKLLLYTKEITKEMWDVMSTAEKKHELECS